MGRTERQERDRLALRTKILDAARTLFADVGYEAVTMRRIAAQIEYSPTAIYSYFQDKETLIRELCAHDFHALAQSFQHLLAEPNPLIRLHRIGEAYLDFGINYPNHYQLMFMQPNPYKDPALLDLERGNPEVDAYAFLVRCVRDAITQGYILPQYQDEELLAQTLWSAVHGVVSLHIAQRDNIWVDWRPVKDRLKTVIETVLRGLAVSRHG